MDVDDINGVIVQRERDMVHAITECHSKSGPKRNCKRVFNRGLQAYVTHLSAPSVIRDQFAFDLWLVHIYQTEIFTAYTNILLNSEAISSVM